jgi:hypothetical protein
LICTLSIHKHDFTFKHLCWHSITKILRNGPRAHFPFSPAPRRAPSTTPAPPRRALPGPALAAPCPRPTPVARPALARASRPAPATQPLPARPRRAEPAPSRAPAPRPCPGGYALVVHPGGRACPRARASATHVPRACTVRVPSARVARSRACDRSRTALNPVLIDVNLCSRRAASRASSRDNSFNLYLLKCCVARFVTRRFF